MKTLLGIREGETLNRLLRVLKERSEVYDAVHDANMFFGSLREPYGRIVLDTALMSGIYPWVWIEKLMKEQPGAEVTVIPSETAYDSLWLETAERLCAEAGFHVLPLGVTPEEAAERVFRRQSAAAAPVLCGAGNEIGMVAAVWSASCKDGATTVALNAAILLARHLPEIRVGLFDLNLKNPELRAFLRDADFNCTNAPLRPKLQTGAVDAEGLASACAAHRKLPNLRVLYGSRRRDTASDFSAEMMETLLRAARRAFDVTILDLSAFPDNAATVCGVRFADVRWLVAGCGSTAYLWNWSEWFECYWKLCGLKRKDVELVMNRFDGTGRPAEKAASALGMNLAGTVGQAPAAAALRANEEGVPLVDLPQTGTFAADIFRLAGRLSDAAGLGPLPERERMKRGSGLLSALSGLF